MVEAARPQPTFEITEETQKQLSNGQFEDMEGKRLSADQASGELD